MKGEHYLCKPDIFALTYEPEDAALAQQREPVAWLVQYDDETRSGSFVTMSLDDAELYCAEDKEIVPLYLAPTIPEEVTTLVRDIHRALKRGEKTEDHGLIGNLRCILDSVLPEPPGFLDESPAAPEGWMPYPARKHGGSFQHTGTVVAEFHTLAGEPRIVLEFDAPVAGMLHIYRPDQIELLAAVKEPK